MSFTRANNELCLLCEINKADQCNSHIVPNFFTNGLFRTDHKKFPFYIGANGESRKTQGIPHIDHVFCCECERKFAVLETYVANKLRHLHSILCFTKFSVARNSQLAWKTNSSLDPAIFRLFIYSIIWRCAAISKFFPAETVSENQTNPKIDFRFFNHFIIPDEIIILLQQNLNSMMEISQQSLIDKRDEIKKAISYFPIGFFTYEKKILEETRVFSLNADNGSFVFLNLNDYKLVCLFSNNRIFESINSVLIAKNEDIVKICTLPDDKWNNIGQQFYHDLIRK
ncbi:MAG: hypothetical protein WCM76_16300 [Bacteroidota bacterium]